MWTDDVTPARQAADDQARRDGPHEAVLNQIGDAVAVFGPGRRLAFHNAAFAALWDLEPAWLADAPTHAEWLDRLRQRRRLPETIDYAEFKAASSELALLSGPGAIARGDLASARRADAARRQPAPSVGGPVHHILRHHPGAAPQEPVQSSDPCPAGDPRQADRRGRGYSAPTAGLQTPQRGVRALLGRRSREQIAASPDFDGVVELCVPRLHDLEFWRGLKARITDPDPEARAAAHRRGDDRRPAHRGLSVAAAARRRHPDQLRRRHRHPPPRGRALGDRERGAGRDRAAQAASSSAASPMASCAPRSTTIPGYAELF